MLWGEIMLCKLCHKAEAIRESHIVPKFVGKWIKATSPTHGLRNSAQPDQRRENLTKLPLLCEACEIRFSWSEKRFAEGVFFAFNREGRHSFAYSNWLLYFAVSLSWRVAVTQGVDRLNHVSNRYIQLDTAVAEWAAYLLSKPSQAQRYSYHLFFDSMAPCVEHVGAYYDGRYALNTTSWWIPSTEFEFGIYVKLPGMTFFTSISPENPAGWTNTQIHVSGQIGDAGQEVEYNLFWEAMLDDARNLREQMGKLSETQKAKLRKKSSQR
jgi:hypothetical protein